MSIDIGTYYDDIKRENEAYQVMLWNYRMVQPRLCTCCMEPTDKTETIKCKQSYAVLATVHETKFKLDVPVCQNCVNHRDADISKILIMDIVSFVIFGIIFGVSVYYRLDSLFAYLMSLVISLLLLFCMSSIIKFNKLDCSHSARGKAVKILPGKTGKKYPTPGIPIVGLQFSNVEYANAFKMVNPDSVVSLKKIKEKNSAEARTLFSSRIWVTNNLLIYTGISILISLVVVSCM